MKYLVIMLLAGIAAFGYFGRIQPVVVVDSSVVVDQPLVCPKCGGAGTVEVATPCPKCQGTGKGEWFFKSRSRRDDFSHSKPVCVACAGKGAVIHRQNCPQCKGTGKITGAAGKKTRTARADLSLWEKMLEGLQVKPDANCAPQRSLNGAYPLVEEYIQKILNPRYAVRVVKWEQARQAGGEWLIKTEVAFKDQAGQDKRQSREFIIQDREVKGSRAAE